MGWGGFEIGGLNCKWFEGCLSCFMLEYVMSKTNGKQLGGGMSDWGRKRGDFGIENVDQIENWPALVEIRILMVFISLMEVSIGDIEGIDGDNVAKCAEKGAGPSTITRRRK